MQLLATSFGKYSSLPLGWIFMAILIIGEALIMSQLLSRRMSNPTVIFPTCVSNILSALAGAMVSKAINGGWMLVVWFPWVSSVEINVDEQNSLFLFIVYIIFSFIATVFIEVILNYMMMKRRGFKRVMQATIISNIITYVVGCFALYAYSFLFYE